MQLSSIFQRSLSSVTLILLVTLFWMLFANISFFTALFKDYPVTWENSGFLVAIIFGFFGVVVMVLLLLCHRYTTKPLLILLLMIAAFSAYFMDSYHVLIDHIMIQNAILTDPREVNDLFSLTLIFYVVLLGVLPSLFVLRYRISYHAWRQELWLRAKWIGGILLVTGILFLIFSASISSFFREHKPIRYYFNPASPVFAAGKFVSRSLKSAHHAMEPLATDAAIPETDVDRELIIMVVGETARADRFSLNGYDKPTNPLLEKERVVSFQHFTSCGTSTAHSVPCMFSVEGTSKFDVSDAKYKENALDALHHAGVKVLWRDNNSSSKGVADRVEYQDYRDPSVNKVCDVECRDVGMLAGLQEYIDAQPKGDILIVLHQMGNHGPAYYKRYPKEFERFTPACHTNELSDCSLEEIGNAYDNAILYTDYFLHEVISLLKQNDSKFETAMLYVSDHGESLGENGLYLHGMPNFIAPDVQKKVPVIMWIGENFDEISFDDLYAKRDQPFTHDNIFHTLLSIMEVESDVYDRKMSLIND